MLDAVTDRTKVAFIAAPNNPTGTTSTRAELDAWFERVPPRVLTVVDQAYFEYIDEPELSGRGRGVPEGGTGTSSSCARSRRSTGSPGLRVGYGVGPAELVTAIGKVRRAFDVTSVGQEAALASIDDASELERRRAANRDARGLLEDVLRRHSLDPVGPAVANFVFVRVGDAEAVNAALLREGVIVRPLGSFGAPDALRITAGTPEEIAMLDDALDCARADAGDCRSRANRHLTSTEADRMLRYPRPPGASRRSFPYANDAEERTGPLRVHRRGRQGRVPAGRRVPGEQVPAAGAAAPVSRRAPRARRHLARRRLARPRGGHRGRRVPLLPRVRRRGRGQVAGGEAGG